MNTATIRLPPATVRVIEKYGVRFVAVEDARDRLRLVAALLEAGDAHEDMLGLIHLLIEDIGALEK